MSNVFRLKIYGLFLILALVSFRPNVPAPEIPANLTWVLGQPEPTVTDTNWNAVVNSIRAMQHSGDILLNEHSHLINSALYIPLGGWDPGLATSTKTQTWDVELLPGYTQIVLIQTVKLYLDVANNRKQVFNVFVTRGSTTQQITSLDSSLIGATQQTFATLLNLNSNIVIQQGASEVIQVRAQLITSNSPNTVPSGLTQYGAFSLILKGVRS